MKKYILSLVAIGATIALLCGCTPQTTTAPPAESFSEPNTPVTVFANSEHSVYSLTEADGKWYMNFPKQQVSVGFVGASDPQFSSISELQEVFKSGAFSDVQKYSIDCLYTKTKQGILALNPDALYRPTFAEAFQEQSCTWNGGECYTFRLSIAPSGKRTIEGQFSLLDKAAFDKLSAERQQNGGIPDEDLISSQVYTEGTGTRYENASYFIYTHRSTDSLDIATGKAAKVSYTLPTEDGTKSLFVEEIYLLESNVSTLAPSNTVPKWIVVYGVDDGVYFKTELTYHKNEPVSTEWLLKVGVEPLSAD